MIAPSTLEPPAPPAGSWSPRRVLAAVAIGAMVAMWVYVLYLALGPGRQPPPNRLDDPAFAVAGQAICDSAHGDVDQLPSAIEADTAIERGRIVAEANEHFAAMVDDLEGIAPNGEDGELVAEWIADWRTYLHDRADYVEALRTDPEAQILVTAKNQDQITEYIDAFAADNRMTACATPIDV